MQKPYSLLLGICLGIIVFAALSSLFLKMWINIKARKLALKNYYAKDRVKDVCILPETASWPQQFFKKQIQNLCAKKKVTRAELSD